MPDRNDSELRESSTHLHYEYSMLVSVTEFLATSRAPPSWLVSAVLESFVIHYRALYDFFYLKAQQPDDVIAAHFFDSADAASTTYRSRAHPSGRVLDVL